MKAFWLIFKISFFRLLRSKHTLLVLALSLIALAMVVYIRFTPGIHIKIQITPPPSFDSWPTPPDQMTLEAPLFFAEQIVFRFFIGFIILVTAAFFGPKTIIYEVETGSLDLLLLRPVSRECIYMAKYLAVGLSLFLMACPSLVLSFFILFGLRLPISFLFLCIVSIFVGAFVYGAVCLFLGMFKWGLYIGLAYVFLWELLAVVIVERVRHLTLLYYLRSFTLQLTKPCWELFRVVPFSEACLVLFIASLFFLMLGLLIFQRKEFILLTVG